MCVTTKRPPAFRCSFQICTSCKQHVLQALRDEICSRLANNTSEEAQLTELLEDLEDYINHIWVTKSNPLDRYN